MPLFTVRGFRIARCRRCDLKQVIDSIPTVEMLGIYGPDYFSHAKYRDRATLRRENRRRVRLLQRHVRTPAARVLEAGCGIGDFIAAAKHTCVISGFDLSGHAVDAARRANPDISHRIGCCDFVQAELPRAAYDAICLWDVIEHLWDVEAACRRLLDSLKTGGVLLLSTPDSGSWGARTLGRYWPLMTPPEHVSFFSTVSLAYLFEERLGATVMFSAAMGKWVNLRFAFRKIQRLAPGAGPSALLARCQRLLPETFSVYLPSHDIRYVAVRKNAGAGA